MAVAGRAVRGDEVEEESQEEISPVLAKSVKSVRLLLSDTSGELIAVVERLCQVVGNDLSDEEVRLVVGGLCALRHVG